MSLPPPSPITPAEAKRQKGAALPREVLHVFNDLIVEKYNSEFNISQDEAIDRILEKMPHLKRHEIFERNWLDIEDMYSAAGWHIDFEKPDRGETFSAYWTFRPKK